MLLSHRFPFSSPLSAHWQHRYRCFCTLLLACLMAASCVVSAPRVVRGGTITSKVSAGRTGVEDSQTDTFHPLSAFDQLFDEGAVMNSTVSASFTSEDQFQVAINNNWDSRNNTLFLPYSFGFGIRNFEYDFVADGDLLSILTSNHAQEPLFPGASTLGANRFDWRLFDMTIPNGFVVISVFADGMQSLPLDEGHHYLLRLSDQSSLSGADTTKGLLHTATFDVSLPASFDSIPEPSTLSLMIFLGLFLSASGRRKS